MKKTITLPVVLLVLATALFSACKKNASSPKETVLSKQYRNDKLATEYLYNNNKQVYQVNNYEPDGTLGAITELEYDANGRLKTSTLINPNNGDDINQYLYTYNNKGEFQKSEYILLNGPDSGKVSTRTNYVYANNRISRANEVNVTTGDIEWYHEYTYYANGNLKTDNFYNNLTPVPELYSETEYTPEGDPLPLAYEPQNVYPVGIGLLIFVTANIHYTKYSGPAISQEYNESMSDRVFNNKGLITDQIITRKFKTPAFSDLVTTWNYEYIEL